MFLNQHEINLIMADHEAMIASPESTRVTLRFRVALTDGIGLDEVYNTTNEIIQTTPEEVTGVKCLQKVLRAVDLKMMPNLIAEVGWAVFYFSESLDLHTPLPGKVAIDDSLVIVDPSGVEWTPAIHDSSELSKFLVFMLGDEQISQPILCHPRK